VTRPSSQPGQPRIAPLPRDQWDDDVRAALATGFGHGAVDRFTATGDDEVPVPNVVGTLMRHPALAGPFLAYNSTLLRTPTLDARHRELTILRVAARTDSVYEWAQHIRIASALGVTEAEIAAIGEGPDDGEWTALEADLLRATDELIEGYVVTHETWARLAAHLDERQLMELVFVVGTYTALAMAFNSFGLQLDDDLVPAATTGRPDPDRAPDRETQE
jgi:alkylhydroperoxidase family enzyme